MDYAVFDWDNTLVKGHTLFGFCSYLHGRNYITADEEQYVCRSTGLYSQGVISHEEFARHACDDFSSILKGKTIRPYYVFARQYSTVSKSGFNEPVVASLRYIKRRGIRVVIISGAPKAVIEGYRHDLGLDEIFAYAPSVRCGTSLFSGATESNYGYNKQDIMSRLVSQYGRPLFAFGDSESDLPLLRSAHSSFFVSFRRIKYRGSVRITPNADVGKTIELLEKGLAKSFGTKCRRASVKR